MAEEVEVKYHVTDSAALDQALAARDIVLSPPSYQDDQAYAPSTWTVGESRIGITFVRLRTQHGRCVFTTKTPVDNVLACVEHETVVADREQMHHAILAMGYVPTVRVAKHRRTAQAGPYSLCVDEVEGVGAFMEVEVVNSAGEDMCRVQAELAGWVGGLGAPLVRTGATYDELVRASNAASCR
ncbi:MAG: class IV adenylate cyclase [Dactylosporangium sp.]|nr:class IV adenylate cyclase [Dactylosporangium sp.]NNJ59519.1 class IV adenylate cyclase [Dactylosporangium sp.]